MHYQIASFPRYIKSSLTKVEMLAVCSLTELAKFRTLQKHQLWLKIVSHFRREDTCSPNLVGSVSDSFISSFGQHELWKRQCRIPILLSQIHVQSTPLSTGALDVQRNSAQVEPCPNPFYLSRLNLSFWRCPDTNLSIFHSNTSEQSTAAVSASMAAFWLCDQPELLELDAQIKNPVGSYIPLPQDTALGPGFLLPTLEAKVSEDRHGEGALPPQGAG